MKYLVILGLALLSCSILSVGVLWYLDKSAKEASLSQCLDDAQEIYAQAHSEEKCDEGCDERTLDLILSNRSDNRDLCFRLYR